MNLNIIIPIILAFTAIGVGIGVNYIQSIKVPNDFERPYYFRILHFTFDVIGKISKVLDFLNIETEYDSHQRMVTYLFDSKIQQSKDNVYDEIFNGVRVRVYHPVNMKPKMGPAMIYIHGNFRAFGSFDAYDRYLFILCMKLQIKVISIDYELPPYASYSKQLEDCLAVMKYIKMNWNELKIDTNKIIMAGDSEGGQLVLSVNQELYKTDKFMPALQVLIYPIVQMYDFLLPSSMKYHTGLIGRSGIHNGNLALWNLGIKDASKEMKSAITENKHMALLKDEHQIKRFESYLNLARVSPEFKIDPLYRAYYPIKPDYLDEIFKKETKVARKVKKLFNKKMSPGLVDSQDLMNAPPSYFLIVDMDGFRDEQLLFAERLKSVKRTVTIAYYEKAFHGMAPLIKFGHGFELSKKMLRDLVKYIQNNL